MPVLESEGRLCIFCRRLESTQEQCPKLHPDSVEWRRRNPPKAPSKLVVSLSADDQKLIESLQGNPSTLCGRCSHYDVIRAFREANPLDPVIDRKMTWDLRTKHNDEQKRYAFHLGTLSSLTLTPSCPLCRLIYAILPYKDHHPDDLWYTLKPFRMYVRDGDYEMFPEAWKPESALFLGLGHFWGLSYASPLNIGENDVHMAIMGAAAIALRPPLPGRGFLNSRPVGPAVDFDAIKNAFYRCRETHGSDCRPRNDRHDLLTTSMLDVLERKVVPCPPDPEYAALSYVWGGVHPKDGALQAGTLPHTIEDAITLTAKMGLRYLWVDALCIDQTPNPTPEQAAAKQAQLQIMGIIYSSAQVTIVANAGTSSDHGLPGVSMRHPRPRQIEETIDGHSLFIMPPTADLSNVVSVYNTRAWTFQESLLATRQIIFTDHMWQFRCPLDRFSESTDFESRVDMPLNPSTSTAIEVLKTQHGRFKCYHALMQMYTQRQMTDPSDSLNATLGILAELEATAFPEGFVWGLPLKSHPFSLAWIHGRTVTPHRRHGFPSWTWAGWEGAVTYPKSVWFEFGERSPIADMEPEFVDARGDELTLDAWLMTLDIVTEPLSEVRVPGGDGETMGTVTERDFFPPNTIPSGEYSCLIARRFSQESGNGSPGRQAVFLVVLDWDGNVARRRTVFTLIIWADLTQFGPKKTRVKLI